MRTDLRLLGRFVFYKTDAQLKCLFCFKKKEMLEVQKKSFPHFSVIVCSLTYEYKCSATTEFSGFLKLKYGI